ncbi:hypothetical protein ABK040_002564 [Willaertia magna]
MSSTNNNTSLSSLFYNKMLEWLKSLSSMNTFYLLLGSFGLGTYTYSTVRYFMHRSFVSKMYISNTDEAFHWFMYWLAENEYSQKSNHFAILSSKTYVDFSDFKHNPSEKDKHSIPVKFIPSPGVHYLKYKGKTIKIEYHKSMISGGGSSNGSHQTTNEYIVVSCLSMGPDFLKEFILDCQKRYLDSKHGKTLIYLPDSYCDFWEPRICKLKRPPKTVKLQNNIFDKLLQDAKQFLSLEKWYNEHGIPFRRGYLLYGPPGTGKSSTVTALAGALDKNICCINLSNKNLTDDNLNSLMLNTPYNSIILLEDIDSCFSPICKVDGLQQPKPNKKSVHPSQLNVSDDENDSNYSNGGNTGNNNSNITLAGLLNCIDGVVAQEGRILFMTTNHIERLPDALIRPGRIDVKYLIDFANEEQIIEMFLNFYPVNKDKAIQFCKALLKANEEKNRKFTCAELQSHFMTNKLDSEAAICNVQDLVSFDLRKGLNVTSATTSTASLSEVELIHEEK